MRKVFLVLLGLLAISLFVAGFALAQSDHDFNWFTLDGGGSPSSGGTYTLSGTIGQPDTTTVTGADYSLAGGFWPGVTGSAAPRWVVNLPIILKEP